MMRLRNKLRRAEKRKLKKDIRERRRKIIRFIKELTFIPKEIRKALICHVQTFEGTDYHYDGWLKHTLLDAPFDYGFQILRSYEYVREIDELDIDGYFNDIIRLRILKEED